MCIFVVVTPNDDSCPKPGNLITTSSDGYISSVVTMETGCGTREKPWKVIVKPGQRINISLYDFGATSGVGENEVAVSRPVTQCRVYAVIRERTVHRIRNITVCGTMSRERNIYISLTNTIEIGLLVSSPKEKESPFFLIRYEGKLNEAISMAKVRSSLFATSGTKYPIVERVAFNISLIDFNHSFRLKSSNGRDVSN